MNLPVSTVIILFRANVPSRGGVGLSRHDLGPVVRVSTTGVGFRAEVLLVIDVLKGPTIAGVLDLPLHPGVRMILLERRGRNEPSGCHPHEGGNR